MGSHGQIIEDPSTWTYSTKKIKDQDYEVKFECKLKPHWHIFSFNPGGDGLSLPPTFNFTPSADYKLVGSVSESGKKISEVMIKGEPEFYYFENKVVYTQKVKVLKNTTIKGKHTYQVCESSCLAPVTKNFEFKTYYSLIF